MHRTFDGKALRRIRRERRMSTTALAAAINRSYQSIVVYEKGSNRPSADVLAALGDALGVPIDAFFTTTREPEPSLRVPHYTDVAYTDQ